MAKKINALNFQDHITREELEAVYALVGDDEALRALCLSQIKKAAETEEMPGTTTKRYEEVDDPRDIFDELYTQPFMGMEGKRIAIIEDADGFLKDNDEIVIRYLQKPSPTGVLVLCCNKLDKRRKVSKTLVKNAVRVDCSRITWQDARKWSVQYTRQNDKKLDGASVSALVKAVGPNLTALKNELDKLILHAGERETITLDDVEELVPNSRERSIFELSDAIAAGNVRDAVELGEQLLLRGEAPEAIIGFLSMRIRTLWQVKRLASEGRSERQIASDLSIPPFAARKASQATRKLADNWFMDKLHLLAEADHELKSTSLPSRARPTWLAQFLASLCRKGQ